MASQGYRRKIFIAAAVLAGIVLVCFSYYFWCLGGGLGYLGGKICAGKRTGVSGRVKSIIFPVKKYQIHLHHWFLALVALAVSLERGFYIVTPQLFYGTMCGLAVQGICCYSDWFHLIRVRSRPGSDRVGII